MNAGEILALLQRIRELGYKHFHFAQGDVVLEVDVESTGRIPQGRGRAAQAAGAREQPVPAAASTQSRADSDLIAIRAPMSGTFFRAPAPNEPPFVEVGSRVSASDTVCIVEVMKLFNTISAGVAGTVVEIAAENEQAVTTGLPLIWIRPGA
ncbi:MAG TPA: acetyl-CoA carboxylase biotin carboxyl carrier protein [Candidatus Baltobacteraceae bacterium]